MSDFRRKPPYVYLLARRNIPITFSTFDFARFTASSKSHSASVNHRALCTQNDNGFFVCHKTAFVGSDRFCVTANENTTGARFLSASSDPRRLNVTKRIELQIQMPKLTLTIENNRIYVRLGKWSLSETVGSGVRLPRRFIVGHTHT